MDCNYCGQNVSGNEELKKGELIKLFGHCVNVHFVYLLVYYCCLVLIFEEKHLRTYHVYVKFVWYKLQVAHRLHTADCCVTKRNVKS